MELTLIRHGQSTANRDGIVQGQLDTQLSELGLRQAGHVGNWLRQRALHWDAVYCSTLQRARDTARVITEQIGCEAPIEDRDLQEIYMGHMQGKSAQELRDQYPDFYAGGLQTVGDYAQFGGESYDAVQVRVARVIDRLFERHRASEHRVLIVSHGAFLFQLAKALICQPVPRVAMVRFSNCSVTQLRLRERRGTYIGEIECHLSIDLLGGEASRGVSSLLY